MRTQAPTMDRGVDAISVVPVTDRPRQITPGMVRRAVLTALFVGGVLFAVNSGDALLAQGLTPSLAVKLVVTLVVPFGVSLTSAALTARELTSRAQDAGGLLS